MPGSLDTAMAMFDGTAAIILVATLVVFFIPVLIIFPPLPVDQDDILVQTHTKLGTTLKGQHARPSSSQDDTVSPTVKSLHIYPLKSCKEIELDRCKVLPSGLQHDRLYTFARLRPSRDVGPGSGAGESVVGQSKSTDGSPLWEILTQRELPLLATVDVDIWLPDHTKTRRSPDRIDEGLVHVRFPRVEQNPIRAILASTAARLSRGWQARARHEFLLPLAFPSESDIARRGYEYANVKIWKDTTNALNMGADMPPQLREYLGVKADHRFGLFRMDPNKQRGVFRCAPRKETVGYQPVVDFQDAVRSCSCQSASASKSR
jgi:hypothetical protein